MGKLIELREGDCLETARAMAEAGETVDAIVCDPPYHLTSIVKRWGNSTETKSTDAYARASKGFMGKEWDGGDIAFRAETWAILGAVLKPGGHLIAFNHSRTYHRMVCAIEDAGFEIRDSLDWIYGSGFPKSHDISKAVDRRKDWGALTALQVAIRAAREAKGWSQSEAARQAGIVAPDARLGGGGYMWFETGKRVPTREQWPGLRDALGLGAQFDDAFDEAERLITGIVRKTVSDKGAFAKNLATGMFKAGDKEYSQTIAATDAAREWEGWGTALKPAKEPIVLARKPLAEASIAAQCLATGTGALNIEACRIEGRERTQYGVTSDHGPPSVNVYGDRDRVAYDGTAGRWPSNVIHDGSPEATAYMGEAQSYFYSAKADVADRRGSSHPTVKPQSLMRWLVRLVTREGQTVLDPFAGSGATGWAAAAEGRRVILCEREADYATHIRSLIEDPDGRPVAPSDDDAQSDLFGEPT